MERKIEGRTTPADYLRKPYARLVVPEQDGTFRAEIMEFPGCIAIGNSAAEALATLEEVAESWLLSELGRGRAIPKPMENIEYSGKLVLRLPKSLHKKAAQAAERDRISLNQFIVSSIAEQVGLRAISVFPKIDQNILVLWQQAQFSSAASYLTSFRQFSQMTGGFNPVSSHKWTVSANA